MANTHMGQDPRFHVTLKMDFFNNEGNFVQVFPDGTRDTSPFRIHTDFLVVTDVDWQYGGADPDSVQTLRISIANLADPVTLRSSVFESTILLNNSGNGGISERMTSGFVVSSNGRIMFDVFPGGGVIQDIIIRGYLLSKK
ncbi:hypothetical protein ACFQZ1_10865 [Bacillus sp. CGMCC 1.60114]|uniref:hypothetical protein n=1 Tax=unclassified Bacillus (in: firmicutes) TaxID=185979 RepID=UPI003625864D